MNNETQKGLAAFRMKWEGGNGAYPYLAISTEAMKEMLRDIEGLLAAQETAFKERVLACVPEEKIYDGEALEGYMAPQEVDGWNMARREVLIRVERLTR